MSRDLPAYVTAAFDQAHKETSEALDKIVAAHRAFSTGEEGDTDEKGRLTSIMAQIECSESNPTGSARLLAIAVDRLARMEK